MSTSIGKLKLARNLVRNVIQGMDATGQPILSVESFFNDTEVIRQFSLIEEIISKQIEYELHKDKKERAPFSITTEELAQVKLPAEDIGVNQFAKCINQVVDIETTKGISGAQINAKLKELGILAEKVDETGKKVTAISNKSKQYGIVAVPNEYNGRKYDKIIFTDKGKQFLLEHFIEIMKLDEVSVTQR